MNKTEVLKKIGDVLNKFKFNNESNNEDENTEFKLEDVQLYNVEDDILKAAEMIKLKFGKDSDVTVEVESKIEVDGKDTFTGKFMFNNEIVDVEDNAVKSIKAIDEFKFEEDEDEPTEPTEPTEDEGGEGDDEMTALLNMLTEVLESFKTEVETLTDEIKTVKEAQELTQSEFNKFMDEPVSKRKPTSNKDMKSQRELILEAMKNK